MIYKQTLVISERIRKMSEKREHLNTQKLYPTVNNDDLLEFRVPGNAKGQMDLANTTLHFTVTVPELSGGKRTFPQNLLGPKQFSSLEIRLNGEAVTRRSCANEYFLTSYFQNLVNYSLDYSMSALQSMGIFDFDQGSLASYKLFPPAYLTTVKNSRIYITDTRSYEIIMPIDSTIFYTNDLLPSNTTIDLSFERLSAKSSCIQLEDGSVTDSVLALSDVYLQIPFKKDPDMFHLERNAIQRPLKLTYDDYVIKRFNVPSGSNNVMMSNLISGNLPTKLFWGLQSIESYSGSFQESSTRFNNNGLTKANLYINGKECSDFPITMSASQASQPLVKFLENANQQLNGYLSRTMSIREFSVSNFLLSTTLDPDTSGSLSFEFEFAGKPTKELVLIVCGIYERVMRIDHNRNFQIT